METRFRDAENFVQVDELTARSRAEILHRTLPQ